MGRGEKELKETWGKRECAGEIKSLCQSYKKLFLDCASLVAQRLSVCLECRRPEFNPWVDQKPALAYGILGFN